MSGQSFKNNEKIGKIKLMQNDELLDYFTSIKLILLLKLLLMLVVFIICRNNNHGFAPFYTTATSTCIISTNTVYINDRY